jgi:hypothetical protein
MMLLYFIHFHPRNLEKHIYQRLLRQNEDGLPKYLFKGVSSHKIKMLKVKSYLPSKCSNFTPWVKLLNSSDKKEIVKYIIWRD